MISTNVTRRPVTRRPVTQPAAPGRMVLDKIIIFLCSANVTKLIVGANIDENGTAQIKICRNVCGESDVIHTTTLTSFSATSYLNVYEYKLNEPVMVNVGNYIEVEYSKGSPYQIYYQRNRQRDSNGELLPDRPLVSVVVEGESKQLIFTFMSSVTCTPFII